MRLFVSSLITLFLTAFPVLAQQSVPFDRNCFDVISIHVVPPNSPTFMVPPGFSSVRPGGGFADPGANLLGMIAFAYDIRAVSFSLLGLPRWAQETAFDITAKSAWLSGTFQRRKSGASARYGTRDCCRIASTSSCTTSFARETCTD